MVMPHIGDYREKKDKSRLNWYILAGVVGISIFVVALISIKALIFAIGFVIGHWIYCAVGVLVLLILIKRIKKNRRKKELRRNEYT